MTLSRPRWACLVASICAAGITSNTTTANTADAQLVLTFTLDDVVLNGGPSAIFENSSNAVGDLFFDGISEEGFTLAKGFSANPPGSVGSATATETAFVNGLDVFEDDFDQDSFDIGDSITITMNASSSATTPGSIFFGQVSSDLALYFGVLGAPTDQYTFEFSYDAHLTGTLDNTAFPGATSAFGDGQNVNGLAEITIAGPENSFEVFPDLPDMPYFLTGGFTSTDTVALLDEMASGTFEVAFDPGDDGLKIDFISELVVNATIDVPEPSSLSLLLMIGGLAARRRRRCRPGQ